ncbi:MAG TPA: stage II sporulation protein M [Steroidobacteraceae bacterium]|jgi:uncharacterized membrane protein SpoIIM required for sporulation|nr:stage II sporulation protein M [Steroidobacteraceae bacterium]
MNAVATASAWLKARTPIWNAWIAQSREPQRGLSIVDAQRRIDRYRAIARDLATARTLLPQSRARGALESLYLETHASIDVPSRLNTARLRQLFRDEIPAAVARLRPMILWMALLMAISALAGWWMISTFPDLISLSASPKMINDVEHGKLWTDDILNITPSSLLSVRIFSNNIVVSLMAFCVGVFFGLGSIYLVAVNGLMLGALLAFTRQHGLDGELFKFISAHGPVELSIICIAGAAGTSLGNALIRPGSLTRRDSFREESRHAVRVLIACAPLLIVCGLIEGFISPDPTFPLVTRLIVGWLYWLLMLVFLSGKWLRRPTA